MLSSYALETRARRIRLGLIPAPQAKKTEPPIPAPQPAEKTHQRPRLPVVGYSTKITGQFAQPAYPVACDIIKKPSRPSVLTILYVTARAYGLTFNDLISARRTQNVVRPRQVAAYLAKKLTLRSLPQIGRTMHRDHTTVLVSVRKIDQLIPTDPQLAAEIENIQRELGVWHER